MLVHVIGPGNSLIAQRRTYPGLGRYPTSIWQKGNAWCDVVHVLVEEHSVPETLMYKIEVGLYDPEKDVRLPAFSAAGDPIAATFAGDVLIMYRDDAETPLRQGDELLSLIDYQVEAIWRTEQAHPFSLTWLIAEPLAEDYQLFVHLRESETGETVAQADGPPLNGWYPTSRWLPKTRITDNRSFFLTNDIEAGNYELVVGFYDLATGQRFGPEYHLETVEIQP